MKTTTAIMKEDIIEDFDVSQRELLLSQLVEDRLRMRVENFKLRTQIAVREMQIQMKVVNQQNTDLRALVKHQQVIIKNLKNKNYIKGASKEQTFVAR